MLPVENICVFLLRYRSRHPKIMIIISVVIKKDKEFMRETRKRSGIQLHRADIMPPGRWVCNLKMINIHDEKNLSTCTMKIKERQCEYNWNTP